MRLRFLLIAQVVIFSAAAQENVPLGEWRIHASYNRISDIALGNGKVYAAAANGIVVLDKKDKSTTTLDKLNGLRKTGIVALGYDSPSDQLFIAYDDGTFDVIKGTEARNFDPSINTVLTGSKSINHISFRGGEAFLSTDYGVLVFDLARSEMKETWRDLGPLGTTLKIHATTFLDDTVFLATDNGVIRGSINDNLLDFNKWKRSTSAGLANNVQFVTTFSEQIFAAVNGIGVFKYEAAAWTKLADLEGLAFSSVRASTHALAISAGNIVYLMNEALAVQPITDNAFSMIDDAWMDEDGKLWVGDERNGLLTNSYGAFESIIPNGPTLNAAFTLKYRQGGLHLLSGGFSSAGIPLNLVGDVNILENGQWRATTHEARDLTGITFASDGRIFLGSYGYGIISNDDGATVIFDETNSSLINTGPPGRNVLVTDVVSSEEGVWVANYGAIPSLHRLNETGSWEGFAFPYSPARYPKKLLYDFEGNVWMLLDPEHGGGLLVFNSEHNEHVYLTDADGSGELPSTSVYSIALDRDGYVWAGTDAGVAYFFDESSDAVKPIFENRFLLRDDKVTAIAVDGGNRKWMGTERGVWLFDQTGEKALLNFTSANSPLLSDKIIDIEIDPGSGEVFFATDRGLVSYRSDATESTTRFDKVKVFPNPVVNNFTGQVGISGLATDAIVKITDVSGKLIFQTVANGGTASWNVRDHRGNRVPTGVFLIFAILQDGSESMVGKIAVVN